MNENITFGDLRRLLTDSGFEQMAVQGPYILFEHPDVDVWQAFRRHRTNEIADPMTIASVHKTLVGFGFLEEVEFEEALRNAAKDRKLKVTRKP